MWEKSRGKGTAFQGGERKCFSGGAGEDEIAGRGDMGGVGLRGRALERREGGRKWLRKKKEKYVLGEPKMERGKYVRSGFVCMCTVCVRESTGCSGNLAVSSVPNMNRS
jgi:hypothetical protein